MEVFSSQEAFQGILQTERRGTFPFAEPLSLCQPEASAQVPLSPPILLNTSLYATLGGQSKGEALQSSLPVRAASRPITPIHLFSRAARRSSKLGWGKSTACRVAESLGRPFSGLKGQ